MDGLFGFLQWVICVKKTDKKDGLESEYREKLIGLPDW